MATTTKLPIIAPTSTPVTTPIMGASLTPSKVTVKQGDTLASIAKANNTTVAALMKANPVIFDPNKIGVGQNITLPLVTTPTTPTPAISPTSITVKTTPTPVTATVPTKTTTPVTTTAPAKAATPTIATTTAKATTTPTVVTAPPTPAPISTPLTTTVPATTTAVAAPTTTAVAPTTPTPAAPLKEAVLAAQAVPTGTILREGMSGPSVKILQQRLQELGYDIPSADGVYGKETRAALTAYQTRNGLKADGEAGPATINSLNSAAAKKALQTPTQLLASGFDVLSYQADYQAEINRRTAADPSDPAIVLLLAARAAKIAASGVTPASPATLPVIAGYPQGFDVTQYQADYQGEINRRTAINPNDPAIPLLQVARAVKIEASKVPTGTTLTEGMTGNSVKLLQQKLKDLGYTITTVDGKFGPETTAALKLYQTTNGLTSDGKAGAATIDSINSTAAKKAPPPAPTPAPTPTPSPQETQTLLTSLSAKYESGGDPGTISGGVGDPGGKSYGTFQLSTVTGSLLDFMNSLKTAAPIYYNQLYTAYTTGGTGFGQAFDTAWKDIATKDPQGFGQLQYEYIYRTLYTPAVSQLKNLYGFNVSAHSIAVQAAVWSISVQHSAKGQQTIFDKVDLKSNSDATIINQIYDSRTAYINSLSSLDAQWKAGITQRYKDEKADALALLAKYPKP